MRSTMKRNTYRVLQTFASSLCAVSTWAFSESVTVAKPSLSGALLAVGMGDWAVVAGLSLSFGLVSLLQRFKRAEAGDKYILFVCAHMTGSLASGVLVYLITQGAFDAPNRLAQAIAIGAAGWGGSTVADWLAEKINRQTMQKGIDRD